MEIAPPTFRSLLFALVVWLSLGSPTNALAQSWDAALAFDQSFTSVDVLESPTGLSVSISGARLWGPAGVSAGFRHVSEPGAERLERSCGFASCVEGPFEQSFSLSTAKVGLIVSTTADAPAEFRFGLTGSFSWQSERLEHVETRETSQDVVGPDLGLGLQADVRFRQVRFGLQPFVYGQFERITSGACDADASCFGSRNVTSVGLGLALTIG